MDIKSEKNIWVRELVRRYFEGFLAPKATFVVGFCVLMTILSTWVIATQWNINSDFKALLPDTSKAAIAMTEVGQRIGSGSALFVVVDSPDKEANRAFAKVLSEKLLEKDSVALAHYHNDKAFFDKNQLLYLSVEDLKKINTRLKKRIKEEKRKANPLFVSLGSLKKKKAKSGFIETKDLGMDTRRSAQKKYKTFLESEDGFSLTLIVRFVETSTDLNATNSLLDEVNILAESLNPTSFNPEMKVEYGGGLINRQKQYKSIVSDIIASALFTIIGLFLILGFYFRRVRAIFLVLLPLIMAILWTLALAFLIFGELTIITVFIFAILLGLGIDFAIHLLASYDKSMTSKVDPVEALISTYVGTGTATIYGALTTFSTFIVLSFAQFRGLSQFGVVASFGVVFSVVAMFTMLPAMLLVLHRVRPFVPNNNNKKVDYSKARGLIRKGAIFSIILALGMSVFSFNQLSNLQFQEDFKEIGKFKWPWEVAQDQPEKMAAWYAKRRGGYTVKHARMVREAMAPDTFERERRQKSIGNKYSSAVGDQQTSMPTILLFDNIESTRKVQREISERMHTGSLSTIRAANSVYAFLPGTAEEQASRLAEIRKIKSLLDKEGTAFLSDAYKKKISELREKLVDKPVTIYDLPLWTKRLFKEAGAKAMPAKEGEAFAFEYTIFLNEKGRSTKGDEARAFLKETVSLAEGTGEEIRVGSPSSIYISMLDEIQTDGVKMMSIAFVVVFLLLVIAFRSLVKALIAFAPLLLGAIWMFGLLAFLGIPLDFFNVIILPVVIGIGIDDGVHFYHRYLELNEEDALAQTWLKVGSAVVMTSMTSIIGFGGLAITNHFGLKSIGFVAICGILTTLCATVLVLPAILYYAEKWNVNWITGKKRPKEASR